MEFSEIYKLSNLQCILYIMVCIVILVAINFLFYYSKELFKHFFKKSLQENEFIITFASEIERDRILTLIKRDREETEELEKMTKDFGLK